MKYKVLPEHFGNQEIPLTIDRIISLRHGTYSDFEYPNYNNILAVEYTRPDDDRIYTLILGKFETGKNNRKYIFGKVESISVFNFYSKYKMNDIIKIFEKFESEIV